MKTASRIFKKVNKTVLIVVVVLLGLRIATPYAVTLGTNWYLQNKLEDMKGHLDDFDLALLRGAYRVHGLKIWQTNVGEKLPLIHLETATVTIAWKELFRGQILSDVSVNGLTINYVDSAFPDKKQAPKDWRKLVKELMPIKISSFDLANSAFHFYNNDFKVPVEVSVTDIDLEVKNLRNTAGEKKMPSSYKLEAQLEKSGKITSKGRFNALKKDPVFDGSFKMENFRLRELNDYLRVYGPVTFNRGTFNIYSEVAIKEGKVAGYVKPFMKKADFIKNNESFINGRHLLLEVTGGMTNLLLRASKDGSAAAQVDFKGPLKKPNIETKDAIMSALSNAFKDPLKQKVDHDINLKDVPEKTKRE